MLKNNKHFFGVKLSQMILNIAFQKKYYVCL